MEMVKHQWGCAFASDPALGEVVGDLPGGNPEISGAADDSADIPDVVPETGCCPSLKHRCSLPVIAWHRFRLARGNF
jgi:hypothetical protein